MENSSNTGGVRNTGDARRGILLGAAYGLAVTCVEFWFMTVRFIHMRFPALPAAMLMAGVLEICFGVVLGLLLSPLLGLRRGTAWHLLGMAALWSVAARVVAVDPSSVAMWMMGPGVGFVLTAVGHALAALRWRWLPWTLGMLALVGAIVTPVVVDRRRTLDREVVVSGVAAPVDAPDVVVVVLDTVRAHDMSAYGYSRPTTPVLESLLPEGVLFEDATSPSTWSLPSHAALFTGWFPSAVGAHFERRFLGPEPPTMAQVFASHGYETRCFTANVHISDGFGLTRGFSWSDKAWQSGVAGRGFVFIYRLLDVVGFSADDKGGGDVASNFERWVAERGRRERPAFVFLNFLEAHFPYHQVPKRFLREFTRAPYEDLRKVSLATLGAQFGRALTQEEADTAAIPATDMYDAGVKYSDYLFGRVVAALRKAGTLDRTVLVVLADHGEMLGEHRTFGHGAGLYEPDVRVPLFVRYPPRVPNGERVRDPVSTLGVFATVLDLAGLPAPGPLHVGSLMPALDGQPAGAPVLVERFASNEFGAGNAALNMPDRRYRVYRSGDWKLALTDKGDAFLFDLAADPGELHDAAKARPDQLERLRDELDTWTTALGLPAIDAPIRESGAAPAVDPSAQERLKALGYVQ